MKVIHLPIWLEPIADRYASDYVEENLGIKKGAREYEKNFMAAKKLFCKEYHEANTGIKATNPTTPKTQSAIDAFEPLLFRGKQAFLERNTSNPEYLKMAIARLKGDVIHLAHIFMEFEGKISSKEYLYKSIMSAEEKEAIDKHRLKRLIIVCSVMAAINSLFNGLNKNQLDLLTDAAFKKIPTSDINKEHFRTRLAFVLKDYLVDAYKNVSIPSALDEAISSDWEK